MNTYYQIKNKLKKYIFKKKHFKKTTALKLQITGKLVCA